MTLIEKLEAKRMERGLSAREFAMLLGVSPALYVKTRKGLVPVGNSIRAGAVRHFPELAESVVASYAL